MCKKVFLGLLVVLLVAFGFQPLQLVKTSLRITVLDLQGNPVEGASIKLYGNLEDYQDEKNALTEPYLSNKKGIAMIKNLDPIAYYLLVQKEDLDNTQTANLVDTLSIKKSNRITIIID